MKKSSLCSLYGRRLLTRDLREWTESFEQIRYQKSQGNRKKGSAHIIDDCLTSNASHLLNILHGNNTVHDGEQDNGDYDEFQQVQKQGAKGLDVNFRNVRPAHQQHTCHNT